MPPNVRWFDPWPEFLKEVDQSLTQSVELHCSGGFVLTILYGVPRATNDLDYIDVIPLAAHKEVEEIAGRESKLAKKHKIYFQFSGGVTDLPENYAERLVDLPVSGLTKLSLRGLESYDLALSKLTRNTAKDREDVKIVAGKLGLNYATLMKRFSGEMSHIANFPRHENTLNSLWKDYFVP